MFKGFLIQSALEGSGRPPCGCVFLAWFAMSEKTNKFVSLIILVSTEYFTLFD